MESDKKLNVNISDIKSASKALDSAQSEILKAKNAINNMGIQAISGSGMAPAGIMVNIKDNVLSILSSESSLLADLSYRLNHNANVLLQAESATNNVDTSNATNIRNSGTGSSFSRNAVVETVASATGVSNISRPVFEGTGENFVVRPVSSTLTPVVVPVNTENTGAIVEPLNDTIEEATEQLNRALKDGDLKAAMVSYKLLKSLGFERQARATLKRNGYKITTVNGEEVIVRINESGSTTNTTPSTNTGTTSQNPTEPTNNPSNEVVAEEVHPTTNVSNNTNTSTSQRQNVVHTNNTNTQPAPENNASTSNTTPTTSTPSTTTTTKPTSIKPNKTNVVNITDDVTTTTKKSSGVGTVVGVGLGTIAAGAAAVAGVRYVKNRNNNKDEYDDENYDDENNNLDDGNEYVDSAQYSNGSNYMDDDYLGPAGSNYTDVDNDNTENDYVDPEDLENSRNDNLSSDMVLDQLNLNN